MLPVYLAGAKWSPPPHISPGPQKVILGVLKAPPNPTGIGPINNVPKEKSVGKVPKHDEKANFLGSSS
jgi:hypothetical protein